MRACVRESNVSDGVKMDTLGFEPRAFRMRSGCDTTTPCARLDELLVLNPVPSCVLVMAQTAAIGITLW